MAGWFDDFARRSARRRAGVQPDIASELDEATGLSRRQVLVRGAVVAGAAWTAPMLMATQASALGVSACPAPGFICGEPDTVQVCCPNETDTCQNADTTPTCIPEGELGGSCGNSGVGQGNCDGVNRCNGNDDQSNNALKPNVCGGEGAVCGDAAGAVCFEEGGLTCEDGFCRRACDEMNPCNTGQICNDGFCAKPCDGGNDCNGSADCVDGICTYVDRPN